jgi:hypothetical protein
LSLENVTSPNDGDECFHSLFPYRFHRVLALVEQQEGLMDIVSWLPCGTAFKVHDIKRFEVCVLPQIGRLKRYKSFSRQLNSYNFKRISSSSKWTSKKGCCAYHHPYFRKDHVDLCRGVLKGEGMYATTVISLANEVTDSARQACKKVDSYSTITTTTQRRNCAIPKVGPAQSIVSSSQAPFMNEDRVTDDPIAPLPPEGEEETHLLWMWANHVINSLELEEEK